MEKEQSIKEHLDEQMYKANVSTLEGKRDRAMFALDVLNNVLEFVGSSDTTTARKIEIVDLASETFEYFSLSNTYMHDEQKEALEKLSEALVAAAASSAIK